MIKHFLNDTFPINLVIAVDNDLHNVTKHFVDSEDRTALDKDKWEDNIDALAYSGVISKHNLKYSFILVFKDTPTISTIAHEVSHIVNRMWEHIYEHKPADEANAYLTEWIYKCFMKTFKITIE